MEKVNELPEVLVELNVHFKISAGPGAGKTTWLVKHVQNILKNSDRLNKTQKVACITYTRIGADTVDKRVKKLSGTNRVDIETIHSFLYFNVIKPFSYLIKYDADGNDLFAIDELSGHIENRLIWDRFRSWKSEIEKDNNQKYNYFSWTKNRKLLISKLSCIDYEIDENNNLIIKFNKSAKNYNVAIPTSNNELLKYKKVYWRKGIMHHEDVLYFTYHIFNKNPRIIEFISNKYPYLFLDEFQDTNPIQTWIINKISKYGTIVGVIGDPAQSIYEFAGARRKDFNDFALPRIKTFKKSHNYRSTHKIIDFLKSLRDDIQQKPKDDALVGEEVYLLIGEANEAIEYVMDLDDDFAVLCRYNKDVNKLIHNLKTIKNENLIDLLYSEDNNYKRPVFIHSLIKAYDFFEHGEYKEAIKEIKKHLRPLTIGVIEKRKVAIEIIEYLKNSLNSPIDEIYKYWQTILKNKYSINKLAGLNKPKDIHKRNLTEFIPFVSQHTKISSKIRTIHQAKGDEFNNVLVCLFDKTDKNGKVRKKLDTILTDHIFNSKFNIGLDGDIGEETRLIYVACSRAKERLFISVPQLSDNQKGKLKEMGVHIEYIPRQNKMIIKN